MSLTLFDDAADFIGGGQIEKMLFFYLPYRKQAFPMASLQKKGHAEYSRVAFLRGTWKGRLVGLDVGGFREIRPPRDLLTHVGAQLLWAASDQINAQCQGTLLERRI